MTDKSAIERVRKWLANTHQAPCRHMSFGEQADLRTILALAEIADARMGVPDGYKLVPIKPTEAMLEDGLVASFHRSASGVWDAMIAAAPPPSTRAEEGK